MIVGEGDGFLELCQLGFVGAGFVCQPEPPQPDGEDGGGGGGLGADDPPPCQPDPPQPYDDGGFEIDPDGGLDCTEVGLLVGLFVTGTGGGVAGQHVGIAAAMALHCELPSNTAAASTSRSAHTLDPAPTGVNDGTVSPVEHT